MIKVFLQTVVKACISSCSWTIQQQLHISATWGISFPRIKQPCGGIVELVNPASLILHHSESSSEASEAETCP